MDKNKPFEVPLLVKDRVYIEITDILPQLMETYSRLQVYKVKIKDSKLDNRLFIPALQTKEALSSAVLEGTQATLEDVFCSQLEEKTENQELKEIVNTYEATAFGDSYIKTRRIDIRMFNELQRRLLDGDVRKDSKQLGQLRVNQNYVKNKRSGQITYTPPVPESVEKLMKNLIEYIDRDSLEYYELINIAVIHAQFESIHPYSDGNGRVGRILIPLYLCYKKVIESPYFFISEALENDKVKYYRLLMNVRENDNWTEWIQFFLETMEKQCDKYIKMVDDINKLYEKDLNRVTNYVKGDRAKEIIELLFQYPIINASRLMKSMDIPRNTAIRYLKVLEKQGILYSDEKSRYVKYYYHDLLSLL